MSRKKKIRNPTEDEERTMFQCFMCGMEAADLALIFRYTEDQVKISLGKEVQKYRIDFRKKHPQPNEITNYEGKLRPFERNGYE